jgi:MFS superfamily sulfate permease-like transporter
VNGYGRLIAGLTAAAVVVPKAMAYATIAGLPVQVGLYTALCRWSFTLCGTSRPLSVSTTTTIAILTGAALGTAAHGAAVNLPVAAATLAVMVGLVLLAAWVLRLGFVANFISEPVLVGFKSGIGLVIVVDQLPKLLGLHIEKTSFFRDELAILAHLPKTSLVTLAVSAAIVVLIFGLNTSCRGSRRRSTVAAAVAGPVLP